MKKQVHAFYAGRVQGVGFRITAEEAAHRVAVVGWVKNLRDKRVELVAEGEERFLLTFLDEIRRGPMRNFIDDVQVIWNNATDDFEDFEIRY